MLSVEHFCYGEWLCSASLLVEGHHTLLQTPCCIGREACSRSNVCEREPDNKQRRVLRTRAVLQTIHHATAQACSCATNAMSLEHHSPHLHSIAHDTQTWMPRSMQHLGGLGDSDAQQQATIEATLRLKDISAEEARIQGDIVIGLRFTIWEPTQAVRPRSLHLHCSICQAAGQTQQDCGRTSIMCRA